MTNNDKSKVAQDNASKVTFDMDPTEFASPTSPAGFKSSADEVFDIELEPVDKERLLADLRARRKHPLALCEKCPLGGYGFKMVPSEGGTGATFAVIGEAPGKDEILARVRRPFIGASGQVLREGLKRAGLDESEGFLTNAVLCRPPDNKLEPYSGAVDCCRPRLEAELSELKDCKRVLGAGKYGAEAALRAVEGPAAKKVTITRQRGEWHKPNGLGLVDMEAVLTVHPAYVLRVPAIYPDFQKDLDTFAEGRKPHKLQTAPVPIMARNIAHLSSLLESIQDGSWVSFDVETDTADTWYDRPNVPHRNILMVGIATNTDATIIINQRLWQEPLARELVNELFQRTTNIAHNGKFDVLWLQRDGVQYAKTDFDTMLAHYVLNVNPPHGLKELGMLEYGIPNYEEELVTRYKKSCPKGVEFLYSMIPEDKLAQYLAWDVAVTHQLWIDYTIRLVEQGQMERPFLELLMPGQAMLTRVEQRGMRVDEPYLRGLRVQFANERDAVAYEIRMLTKGVVENPRSHVQNGKYVFEVLGYREHTSKHYAKRSTCGAAIENTPGLKQEPFTELLLKFRRIDKIITAYVDTILAYVGIDGRVHPSYNLHRAKTGRLSANKPAWQTLPRAGKDRYGDAIRSAVIAEEGHKLLMGDYSQAEMRRWAWGCQDPFLLEVYRSGRDLHDEGANLLFGEGNWNKEKRTWIKNLNFSYIYGGNEYSFGAQFNLPAEKAREIIRSYDNVLTEAPKWRERMWRTGVEQGYIESSFGRRLYFWVINEQTLVDIQRACWNMPIQGDASDLNLLSAIELDKRGWPVVLSMHDATGMEIRTEDVALAEADMKEVMEGLGEKWFPGIPWLVDIDVLDRWAKRLDDTLDVPIVALYDAEDFEHFEVYDVEADVLF